jgi:D-arabinose 1-dehydrogenase-like Zn-dependent alcohol dehydrogenase
MPTVERVPPGDNQPAAARRSVEEIAALASDVNVKVALEVARRADDPDAVEDLLGTTEDGIDVVVDTVGHDDTLELARRLVRPGGRVVGVGYSPTTTLTVPTPRFVLDEVDYVGSRYAHRDDLARAVSLVDRGLVSMIVGLVRPLSAVNEVVRALEQGSVVGRAVLEVVPRATADTASASDIVSAEG